MNRWHSAVTLLMATTTVSTLATTPAIANDSDLFCYMRTEGGRLVNLGDVCGVEELPAPVISSPATTVSSSSSSALSSSEDIQAFMTGCTDSALSGGWTTTQVNEYCSCTVRGIQASGMSSEQFNQFGEWLLFADTPAPTAAVQNIFEEVVLTCVMASL